jgi:FkbH-like protein
MAEPVRLVIWDLDGTFWAGTLTEGGYTYSDSNHHIVVELAQRGIVSSICSKNDYETVKSILEQRGIWEYFVFPSINWNPKGPRLKQMVEDVQLRPETVLLLDDNPLNINEVKHFVPGIQTADDSFIPHLLDSPLFTGKDDSDLSRLKQYRLLETRKADEVCATDNIDFLRSSNITVTIDRDVQANIDRAIELINRTNQLNFTKIRLPKDAEAARQILSKELKSHKTQAGLIRVKDRYGDYGYCGFFLAKVPRNGKARLHQFCFSCRVLNMGIEHWLYERLGRPKLKHGPRMRRGSGTVLSDLGSQTTVDWIKVEDQSDKEDAGAARDIWPGRVLIRGACNVSPLMHYFQIIAWEVIGEFYDLRNFVQVRRDHSLMLQYGIEGCTPEQWSVLHQLGYEKADLETKFADTSNEPAIRILCNWADCQNIVYRHRVTGLLVPYKFERLPRHRGNLRFNPMEVSESGRDFESVPEEMREAMRRLRRDFDYVGQIPEAVANRALDTIFHALPAGSPLFIVPAAENWTREVKVLAGASEINARVQRAIARHPDKMIFTVALEELAAEDERQSAQHFDRTVYFRLYQHIWNNYQTAVSKGARFSQAAVLEPETAAASFLDRVLTSWRLLGSPKPRRYAAEPLPPDRLSLERQ